MSSFARLVLLHLFGNAALLGLGYYWLGVGESDGAMLALSIGTLLLFVAGAVWLHGVSLAYFRNFEQSLRSVFTRVARHLPALVVFAIAVFALYMWLGGWNPSSILLSIASFFTMTFQKPVRPGDMLTIFQGVLWVLRWWILPVLLLPLAAAIADRNWRGFGEFGRHLRDWKVWLLVPALLFAGVWVPLRLAAWTPVKGNFGAEIVSLIARLSAGYLLFVTACLAVAFITSRGKPSLSQLTTVPSP